MREPGPGRQRRDPRHSHLRCGSPANSEKGLKLRSKSRRGVESVEETTMADLDWSRCPAVESVPGKVSGAWVFRGTRMPVQTVFDNLEAGMSVDEITEVFDVTPEEVRAVLHFASESLAAPALAK